MKYMLDTNICIYAIKNSVSGLREYMASVTPGEMTVSSITLSELKYGACKSKFVQKNMSAIYQFLATISVLPYGEKAADEYGRIRADLEKSGMMIGTMDILIAAHAKSEGLIAVTHNTKEFQRVEGLSVEDWVNQLS